MNWEFRHFNCDGLICVNGEHYERHRQRYPSVLIPNGVDDAVFSPGPGEREKFGLAPTGKIVLMVSTLIPSKRVLEGIEAVAGLSNAQLVVAGDGELRREVDELGRQKMGQRFRRVMLPRRRMPELYHCADVFLHMSQDEPCANALLEALASGLPVVAHDGATSRWMLEDAALLVDTQNASAVRGAATARLDPQRAGGGRISSPADSAAVSWDALARQYGEFSFRAFAECIFSGGACPARPAAWPGNSISGHAGQAPPLNV